MQCLSHRNIQSGVYLPVHSRRRVDVIVSQRSGTVEILQHAEQTSSVPIIRHAATVIDVSCSVYEHLDSWAVNGDRWMRKLNQTKETLSDWRLESLVSSHSRSLEVIVVLLYNRRVIKILKWLVKDVQDALHSAHLVWDIQVLIQKHLELADADVQIAVCKLVGDVKAQRAKLTPLQHDSVEETERQEQRLEVGHLRSGAVTQDR